MRHCVALLFSAMLLSANAADPIRGIEFARPSGQPLFFDAQIPDGDGPFPAVILVHGGGWVRGDRITEMTPLFEPLNKAGFAWFTIDYRLAKDPLGFGTAYRDVESAVQFVVAHAAEYKVDPDRIALIGESAGGHLAAMAVLSPDLPVKTVIAMYAPTDLGSLAQNAGMIPDAVRDNINNGPWGSIILARLSQLSPADHLRPNMPPFLFIHGTNDPLVPIQQSRDMCAKLKTLGNICELYPMEGAGHGMRRWQSSAYQTEIVRWLRKYL